MRDVIVALAGNPNSGKTTVFNALTGARQHVGNYAGVTVEKKEGTIERDGVRYTIVDLPGTYSLSAQSPEEVVARDYLVDEKPDVVVQVVDASNIERNMFLTTQLMELGVRLVVALNMTDVAKARGMDFNLGMLSAYLKAPVTPTVGNRSQGTADILAAVAEAMKAPPPAYQEIQYPGEYDQSVAAIDAALTGEDRVRADRYPPKWMAARLFENDSEMTAKLSDHAQLMKIGELRSAYERDQGDPPEIRAAEAKYGWIAGLTAESTIRTFESRADMSDKIDAVLLNRWLGLPIFLALMYVMFQLVFTLAEKPMEWIEWLFGAVGQSVAQLWPRAADSPLRDLVVDGIIGGVGGVLVFLPNILLLFLAIAFLEGTGYMARAAFIMDGIMHRIGLHGKSFIPMLLGFGCTVPAIMGTRTLENRRDRLTTILVLPFMSCGARLPIYALIIPAFFPGRLQAWMLWLIYVIGILFAVAGAKILRSTVFKGDSESFVMELPPYRMPTLRTVLLLMWERAGEYCKKAGTIILVASIVLWAMTAYPKKPAFDRDYEAAAAKAKSSYLASAGNIGREAGIGADGGLLADWAEAREERDATAAEYWPGEAGYAEAERGYAEKVGELYARPGGDRLKAFIEVLNRIDAIHDDFAAAAEGEAEDSLAYKNAVVVRAAALAELGADPALRQAAEAYRDDALGAYREVGESIANEKQGEELAWSVSGRIGRFLEPVLKPLGFDWRVGTAIIGSFAAKEVFVAQMGIVFAVGEADAESDSLRDRLRENYTPLQAFCMMLYCLLSMPCVATLAVTKREAGGWSYALAMMVGLTLIAYATTFIVYQAGSVLL